MITSVLILNTLFLKVLCFIKRWCDVHHLFLFLQNEFFIRFFINSVYWLSLQFDSK